MTDREQLPIGTRITFIKTLTGNADEDSPACLYANKGDMGTLVEGQYKNREGYWATVDWWPNAFGIARNEFEVIKESI